MATAVFSKDADLTKLTKPVRDDAIDFQRFVHVLSSLMKDEVKQELASFFKIHDENAGGKFSGDNVEFCNLMKQKGIISPSNIEPLKDALRQCDKEHISNIAADMFTLFTEGKLGVSMTEEKDKAGFNVFLEMLSLLMKKDVKRELESVFDLSDAIASRTFSGDNVAFCCELEEKGIISPVSIRLLKTALRKGTLQYVADKFFELFTEGRLDFLNNFEEEKEVSFKQLLNMLSSLMSLEVQEALESVLDIPEEHAGNKVRGNNVAICNLMKAKKIISPSSIQPLIIVLTVSRQRSAAKRASEMFSLFEKNSLHTSIFVKEEEDFRRFVQALSTLMKDEVKQELSSFFKIHDKNTGGKFNGDNAAFCNLMKQRGIISISNITPLKDALRQCDKQKISIIAADMFTLFKERRFSVSTTKEKEANFKYLLDMLSSLMTQEVQEALESVFDISEVLTGDTIRDSSTALCNLMKEKKIISPSSVQPFIIVLKKCGQSCAAKLASEMFSLFEKQSLHTSIVVKEEEEREYQRFLKILSLQMTKKVKQELKSFFVIPEVQADGNFNGDNVAFCNYLREMGIISPLYIELLTIPLRECGKGNGSLFSETLFKFFKEGRFSASIRQNEKGSDFQRFLDILSLLMTKEVREGLQSFFDIPELVDGDILHGDSVAFCTVLKNEGIISPSYIELLTTVIKPYAQKPAIEILDSAIKLFKEKRLGDPATLKGKKEAEFQKFLDILSPLMTDEVKRRLELFFDLTQGDFFHKFKDHNAAICNFLWDKGIISQTTIELLTLALEGCGEHYFAEACNKIFQLFKGGKLCATANLKKEKDAFPIFLDILSLLMTQKVKKELMSLFDIPEVRPGGKFNDDNIAFCNLLEQKGIISPACIQVLTISLNSCQNQSAAQIADALFRLFKKEKLNTSVTPEEEEGFGRFIKYLSSVLNSTIKHELVVFFEFSDVDADKILNSDNMEFCDYLRSKLIISPRYIFPLEHALWGNKTDDEMKGLSFLERHKKFLEKKLFVDDLRCTFEKTMGLENDPPIVTARRFFTQQECLEKKIVLDIAQKLQILMDAANRTAYQDLSSENTQNSTQSIHSNVGKNDEKCQDSETEEGRSPEDVESIQITSSELAVQPMMHHAEDNTQGITQSIDENVGNNDKVQDLETVPLDIVKELKVDFRQHQRETAIDTDDSTDEDEELFSRAGGSKCLEATASISKEGGVIRIPNTEIELQIQPNSFLRDDEIHPITVKILPRRLFDEASSCFEDHSTVMVEILPNNLTLQSAAKLTLPHCLILRDPQNCDVQIFHSHHNPDQLPQWEDITTSVQHELSANVCHIWIENFSWIKYNVGGKEIEGKKLFVYTLGKRYTRNSKFVTAEVGYFPALPGNDKIKLEDADFITSSKGTRFESKLRKMFQGDWQTFVFWKEPKTSLQISVSEINPDDGWKSSSTCPKYISYQDVEISNEQSQPFTFQRKEDEAPFPVIHFKVCQGEKYSEIYVDMEEGLIQDELQVATNQQRKQDKNNTQLTVQTGNAQFNSHEISVSEALRPVNEAKQVHETEMILSPNGEIAIKDHRQEAITLYQPTSTNVAMGLSNRFQAWGPSQRRVLQPQLLGPQEKLPILSQLSPSDISKLSSHLDADHPLGMDWRKLADALGFNCGNTWNFKRNGNPTETVIMCACQSGKLRTKDQLLQVLEDMGRLDARLAISDRPIRNSSK